MSVIEKVLYDPIDPELIHSVYYDTDEDTIAFTRPDKKVTYEFCTKENAASIIQKYAIKNGVLENKPKYMTSDAKITWKIIQQDKEELNIEYYLYGKLCKLQLHIPGLDKHTDIDVIRDIISTAIKNEIMKVRLVGLAGTFIDTTFKKEKPKDKPKEKEDDKHE